MKRSRHDRPAATVRAGRFLVALLALGVAWLAGPAYADPYRVLVVMSYEENNPWVREIAEGVRAGLGKEAEITFFYMNTKADPANGPKRAAEAHALFQKLRPHGVITADDDAQSMFVLPYLRDKVNIPIMFNGVNAAPEKHGFPTSNISGVLERAHVEESLAFALQMFPDLRRVCFLTNDVAPGRSLRAQVERERSRYPVAAGTFFMRSSLKELTAISRPLMSECGALFVDSLEGMLDDSGVALNNAQIMKVLRGLFPRPIIAGNAYQVEQGAWFAVVKTGQEQGQLSAEMLLAAMRGRPVSQIPIQQNTRGLRIINASAMEKNGVKLRPELIRGARVVSEKN
ncbi:MAG: ABC transporter substrate-binding protein [Pseudomonadota bacterium]